MYQALYRKWRPKAFADVVGQEHITETLRRQVEQGRLSHAYLFTGTRGTGKTTCAKILSKAVNCEHPVHGDPCNACASCLGIDNGSLLDVLELDAASNNGVDHVRALRDEAIYSPARVKYRVYIVDEVHMLSTPAFNALLKILEEPPAHLIFILATTELHKVPATILSRCQRFAFKRIQPMDIAGRLQYVARAEGMTLEHEASQLLARLADGALRDALSLLDQCGVSGTTIDSARVLDVLGLAGSIQTAQLMELLVQRDVPAALLQLDALYTGGKDVAALLGELSALARDMLIRITAAEGGMALLSGAYDLATMDALLTKCNPTRLLYMTTQLQNTLTALPMSSNRRTDAELCLIRLCDESLCGDVTALSARLARLEEGGVTVSAPTPSVQRPQRRPIEKREPVEQPIQPVQRQKPVVDIPPWEEPAPIPVIENEPLPVRPIEEPMDSVACAPPTQAVEAQPALWWTLLETYKNRLSPMYRVMMEDASGALEGDVLLVRCGDDFTRDALDCPEVIQVFSEVTGEYLQRKIQVRFMVGKADKAITGEERLEALIRAGSKFDSFTVK